MASQSAPNCKQKKTRKQKNRRTQKSHKHVIFAFFCLISAQFLMIMFVFSSSHNLHSVAFCWFGNMGGLAEDESCWFRPPKSVQEEDFSFVQSNFKSTQYKDKCNLVPRWETLGTRLRQVDCWGFQNLASSVRKKMYTCPGKRVQRLLSSCTKSRREVGGPG